MLSKEGIGPPDIVIAAGDPRAPVLLAQDVAQPPTDPAVERSEYRAVAVVEVFRRSVALRFSLIWDKPCPAVRVVLAWIVSLNFLRLLARGRRRPAANRYPKKSKPSSWALTTRVLVGCRVRPACAVHCCTSAKAAAALLRASTQDHEVVRVPHHLKARLGRQMIERVEIDVAEQRTAHCTLRGALLGGSFLQPVEHPLFKEGLDQPEDATVRHLCPTRAIRRSLGIVSK